jgi:hypothetical protein
MSTALSGPELPQRFGLVAPVRRPRLMAGATLMRHSRAACDRGYSARISKLIELTFGRPGFFGDGTSCDYPSLTNSRPRGRASGPNAPFRAKRSVISMTAGSESQ